MGQDPNAIRQEIEETRAEMGDTVEALGYKADVKGRARAKITSKRQSLRNKIVGAKDQVTGSVSGASHQMGDQMSSVGGTINEHTPSRQDIQQGARQAVGMAQQNPIGLAIGAIAVGFIAGLLAPRTRIEDEKLGPMSTQVKEQAREAGQQALQHGQQVAQEVAGTVQEKVQETVDETKSTAKDAAQQHAQEMKGDVMPGQSGEGGGESSGQGGTGSQPPFGESAASQRQSERAGVT